MKTTIKYISGAIIIIAIVLVIYYAVKPSSTTPPVVQTDSIIGCYVATTGKDVYTLNVASEQGTAVNGTLRFKNFEKDSSSGTFTGTYENGILLGDYAFQSEGMDSVMQVIFKKSGDNFIRGYGEMTEQGTRFADVNKITYDEGSTLAVFKGTECGVVGE